MYYQLFENLIHIYEEDDFDSAFQPISKEEHQERIKQTIERLKKEQKWIQNPDGTFSCNGDVNLYRLNLPQLPVKFKEIKGSFDCSHNNLTSLQGAPAHVGGSFYCNANKLTSLEGAPQFVSGTFYCSHNNLTSLQGAPAHVGDSFSCSHNNLTSLQGAPAHVGGYFDCYRNPVPEQQLKQTVKRDYL